MPELPEVEVLVRHLQPLLRRRVVRSVNVRRAETIRPNSAQELAAALSGARFIGVKRRGKYLLFTLKPAQSTRKITVMGHLGMTGRMYLLRASQPLPKHAAIVLDLGETRFVYEDTRYFGRFTLDTSALDKLGPEPLDSSFSSKYLASELSRCAQCVKVKLLDQSLVAGVGNIYASEALHHARISPRRPAQKLRREQVRRLWQSIRCVLRGATKFGSTVPLNWTGKNKRGGLFYYGRNPATPDYYHERLRVYDREGQRCLRCKKIIKRLVQAGRSTYYCPGCQH